MHRLQVAYGPKTTKGLIEGLFNLVKTLEKRRELPFTYYEPKPKKDSGLKKPVELGLTLPDLEREKDATIGRRAGSNPTHITYQPQHLTIEGSMKKKKSGSVCNAVTTASTTSSSSASIRTMSSSSKSKRSSLSLRLTVNHAHAAPEGRVVVEKDGVVHVGMGAGLDGQLENVHEGVVEESFI